MATFKNGSHRLCERPHLRRRSRRLGAEHTHGLHRCLPLILARQGCRRRRRGRGGGLEEPRAPPLDTSGARAEEMRRPDAVSGDAAERRADRGVQRGAAARRPPEPESQQLRSGGAPYAVHSAATFDPPRPADTDAERADAPRR
eukprot:gene8638-biopygen8869